MAKRRTVILGLGTLATGAAASLTGASLANTASAQEGDFRVVVEDGLVVEPGNAFRNSNNKFNPDSGSARNWAYNRDDGSLFNGEKLNSIDVDDDPKAAAVNDEDNDSLRIEIATWLDENAGRDDEFANLLQVRNTGTTQRNVGIGFDDFGDDVDDTITEDDVRGIYEFENSDGFKISENDYEDIANWFTIEAGGTRQITLSVDTRDYYNEILELADGTDPFSDGGGHTTVDLVDSVRFGTQESDPQNPDELS